MTLQVFCAGAALHPALHTGSGMSRSLCIPLGMVPGYREVQVTQSVCLSYWLPVKSRTADHLCSSYNPPTNRIFFTKLCNMYSELLPCILKGIILSYGEWGKVKGEENFGCIFLSWFSTSLMELQSLCHHGNN